MVPDLNSYDHIVIAFSGGKDSVALLLNLIELEVDLRKVMLLHHNIDGEPESEHGTPIEMDWPVTPAYCQAIADRFNVPLCYTWREGGLGAEILKQNSQSADIQWESPGRLGKYRMRQHGNRSKVATRKRFPQVAADLRTRWCSAFVLAGAL